MALALCLSSTLFKEWQSHIQTVSNIKNHKYILYFYGCDVNDCPKQDCPYVQ